MLKAQNIEKKYGTLNVLKGVNTEVQKGEVVSIVGSSGAGKSTLLHILGTLDKADQGTLEIEGINISNLKQKQLAKFRNEKIGFVFQFHNLLPEFTALENVSIPGLLGGKSESTVRKKAEELLELLNLTHRIDHKPTEMSGGEQQRAAVARALINSPSIVFADEPSGNLDSKNADDLHNLFFQLQRDLGQTFIIVTHNNSFADMADRKLVMKDGLIV